jgi:hypothetical protein
MKRYGLTMLLLAPGLFAAAASRDTFAQAAAADAPAADVPGTDVSAAESQSATDRALEELAAAYEGLSGLLGQRSDEAVDLVQDDIENLGDWEYRIVELEDAPAETLEAQLNLLGDERWEVYWVESGRDGARFYLKRPSISYLSRVPLSTLVRMLAGGGQ